MSPALKKLGLVALYAIAMAWVESAVVVYLRTLIGRMLPYQPDPLPIFGGLGWIEAGREAATLVMLLAVGCLAGGSRRVRLAYALIAFAVWDIFYYVFLVPMSGWPHSLLDWDVLFLLPLPWWGPVLAPVLISLLLLAGGLLVTQSEAGLHPLWPRPWAWRLHLAGAGLALYAFMETPLHALPGGAAAVRSALPASFNWPLFAAALALFAAPLVDMARQLLRPSPS